MPVPHIPAPQVLDPDRVPVRHRGENADDDESRARVLDAALHESCAYARQLWLGLDSMRVYLLESLPPDPRVPADRPTASASPTGPDDALGWNNWIAAYAAVNSVLCGPHGDSGYGLSEGRHEAGLRRRAPLSRIYADHPGLGRPERQRQLREANEIAADTSSEPADPRPFRLARAAATAALVLLAVRGLRPRRAARTPQPGAA